MMSGLASPLQLAMYDDFTDAVAVGAAKSPPWELVTAILLVKPLPAVDIGIGRDFQGIYR